MITLVSILGIIVQAIVVLIIVQFVIGLLFSFNVVSPSNQFLMQVYSSINALMDPLLRPIRKILPDTGAIDFSPLVLIIGLQILMRILSDIAFRI
ncbi:YggT family protein [Altererythrobacter atlanticus]|uniref:YGGT family protein n=1 Tax=Croceibacterium atlanticum TaxID=1267766 RepID=A0A0F7KV46_9SPHN|nr:YggT family protein [Croceibacterium atlanticum]AKH43051.1 YGGT family protein [Croceibacterium atlanticum]MBB5732246.1 YggT family protein [Croceibacterium atlanticum]